MGVAEKVASSGEDSATDGVTALGAANAAKREQLHAALNPLSPAPLSPAPISPAPYKPRPFAPLSRASASASF